MTSAYSCRQQRCSAWWVGKQAVLQGPCRCACQPASWPEIPLGSQVCSLCMRCTSPLVLLCTTPYLALQPEPPLPRGWRELLALRQETGAPLAGDGAGQRPGPRRSAATHSEQVRQHAGCWVRAGLDPAQTQRTPAQSPRPIHLWLRVLLCTVLQLCWLGAFLPSKSRLLCSLAVADITRARQC